MNILNHSLRTIVALVTILPAAGCGDKPGPEPGSGKPHAAEPAHVGTKAADSKADDKRTPASETPFQLVEVPPEKTGVTFLHVSGNAKDKPFPAANGSGVGALDYDLDGRYDLYFANGTLFPLDPKRVSPINRLYRNLGDWTFADVTDATGLGHFGFSSGIAVGDYDSDGFPDVYVTCFGKNQLYRNRGDGTFENVGTQPADGGDFSTSAAFLDADGDGLLDLYVCNYGKWSYEQNHFCGDRQRNIRIFCSPKSLDPERHVLLHNEGDGTFRDLLSEAGLDQLSGRGQGVLATDADGDGKIDLYVGNDIHPNFLYLNDGAGRFRDMSELSGAAYDRNGQMQAGMGVAGADFNRDGLWDLFVTNFEGENHTLYRQTAPADFHDVSETHDIAAASKPWVGWGTAFVDFDLDGWKDLIATNGHVDDNLKEMGRDSPYDHPALAWRNERGRFRFLGETAGSYFRRPHPGRGLATVDLDNDGDTDIVITHQDQQPALLRNVADAASVDSDAGSIRHGDKKSVVVRLIGTRSNRDAVGSTVVVISKGTPRLEQVMGGGSYLSAHDLRLILAVEEGQPQIDVEIRWPSGRTTSVTGLLAGHQYDIIEPPSEQERPHVIKRHFQLSAKRAGL